MQYKCICVEYIHMEQYFVNRFAPGLRRYVFDYMATRCDTWNLPKQATSLRKDAREGRTGGAGQGHAKYTKLLTEQISNSLYSIKFPAKLLNSLNLRIVYKVLNCEYSKLNLFCTYSKHTVFRKLYMRHALTSKLDNPII